LNGINARTKVTPGYALLVPGKDAIGHDALAARLPQTPASPPKAVKPKKGKAGKGQEARNRHTQAGAQAEKSAEASQALMQRTSCVAPKQARAGIVAPAAASASGQRGWKWQPCGRIRR
jgi:hypothetical protein